MSKKPIDFLYLSQEDVRDAGGLDIKMAIDAIERAFRMLNAGDVRNPDKIVMVLPPGEQERGRMNGLAAHIGGDWEVAGIKWIPSFPKNPSTRDLPRASALIILNDAQTGMPLAVMDGTLISAMRTGAVGGIGAKYLSREDSKKVGIIGAGVQSRTQLMAICAVRDIDEARVFDISQERSQKFADEMKVKLGIRVVSSKSAEETVRGADIVDTVTVANEPIVKDAWMKPGSLFVHVGSYVEEEYDVVLHSDKIIVDDWEVVKHRKTPVLARMFDEGLIKDEDIYANLDDIVAGKKSGREINTERIFFSPIGMAHEDIAVASMVYEKAKKEGIGQTLKLWTEPMWV